MRTFPIPRGLSFLALPFLSSSLLAAAGQEGLVAWWSFDRTEGGTVVEQVVGSEDRIDGHFEVRRGVSGAALKFDGFTTRILRSGAGLLDFQNAFTVSAWIAPQAYPWNWSAIVAQDNAFREGYFFGVDAFGRIGLGISIGGAWTWCASRGGVPFMDRWSHVAGVFDADSGISIYLDGEVDNTCQTSGEPVFAHGAPLQIGRNLASIPAAGLVRPWLDLPISYSFDGLMDELKIYRRALSEAEVQDAFQSFQPGPPDLEWRRLPRLPAGQHAFGASYTRLSFYPEWDRLWPVAEHPDVVVLFDQLPTRMVFWRGTGYNLNLVSENDRWVADQGAEDSGNWNLRDGPLELHPTGRLEHRSDKQVRYSHVRVIENQPARVVVHWRYALADVLYRIGNTDPLAGWGDWVDEYYSIYPDGVAVRSVIIHGSGAGYGLTEPTVVNQAGEKAEDNIELQAVTLCNLAGMVETLSWESWPQVHLEDPSIALLNLKSRFRPFYVYEKGTMLGPYEARDEARPDYSRFPTWNHWPASRIPSDGRYALAADRVSSSAILSPEPPLTRSGPDQPWRARYLLGQTDKPVQELLPLASSWLSPPAVGLGPGSWQTQGFDRDERAFLVSRTGREPATLALTWSASADSPLVNPAVIVENWGDSPPSVRWNRKQLKEGKDFRYSLRRGLEGTDLVLFLEKSAQERVELIVSADR